MIVLDVTSIYSGTVHCILLILNILKCPATGQVQQGAVDKALKVIIQKVQSFGSEPFVVLDKNAKIWYNISIESEGSKC